MNNNYEIIKKLLPLWSYQLQRDSKLALKTRSDLVFQLLSRCLEDNAFKHELIANPKEVIKRETEINIPESLELLVVEETEKTLYLILPCNPYEDLQEEELKISLGLTVEEVASWAYEQQGNLLLEEKIGSSIIARSWKDPLFKQELLNHPKAVVEKEFGQKIPEDIEIQVLCEDSNTLYLVIPKFKDALDSLAELKIPNEKEEKILVIALTFTVNNHP